MPLGASNTETHSYGSLSETLYLACSMSPDGKHPYKNRPDQQGPPAQPPRKRANLPFWYLMMGVGLVLMVYWANRERQYAGSELCLGGSWGATTRGRESLTRCLLSHLVLVQSARSSD